MQPCYLDDASWPTNFYKIQIFDKNKWVNDITEADLLSGHTWACWLVNSHFQLSLCKYKKAKKPFVRVSLYFGNRW